MPFRLRFLLDTNILIPLQDSMVVLQPSLTHFVGLCNANGHQLLYHQASVDDIRRDTDEARKRRTLARLRQYTLLQEGAPCPWNAPDTNPNDACDNRILWALQQNAAHALVTEDQRLHRKARERGLGDRVYFIQTADDWLRRLHEPESVTLPNIEELELHVLTTELPSAFFESIRQDYAGFNDWFARIARAGRRAWVYRPSATGNIDAICIFDVQTDEEITDTSQRLAGRALKLCTFKVGDAVRGRKIGELFLRAAFQFATNNQCENIFLHSNPAAQEHLTNLLADFGFNAVGHYRGDTVFVKPHPVEAPALQMQAFDYVRRFYPHYLSGIDVQKFLVPIKPRYHNILFPDCARPGRALPAGHPQQHVGNAIKLAYLCNAGSRAPGPGDIVLFYRSHDQKAVTTLGVIEQYEVMNRADQIARLVSRRTVYSKAEIVEMTGASTKVMLFRLIRHFENPVTYADLRRLRVVRGYIQSITQINDVSFSRILAAVGR